MSSEIVRLFEGLVRPGASEDFSHYLSEVVEPDMRRRDGLLSFDAIGEIAPERERFLITTVWDGVGSLKGFASSAWHKPRVAPEEANMLRDASVRHFDRVAGPSAPTNSGRVELDPAEVAVRVDGRSVPLPPLEYRLFEILYANRGRLITAAELAGSLWPGSTLADPRDVRRLVYRLRRALRAQGAANLIRSRNGLGYMLAARERGSGAAP